MIVLDHNLLRFARMQIARCRAETDYSDGLLEALALNVPVVQRIWARAWWRHYRITYRDDDAVDRCTKKADVTDNDWAIRSNQDGSRTGYDAAEGASQVADWLTQETLGD